MLQHSTLLCAILYYCTLNHNSRYSMPSHGAESLHYCTFPCQYFILLLFTFALDHCSTALLDTNAHNLCLILCTPIL